MNIYFVCMCAGWYWERSCNAVSVCGKFFLERGSFLLCTLKRLIFFCFWWRRLYSKWLFWQMKKRNVMPQVSSGSRVAQKKNTDGMHIFAEGTSQWTYLAVDSLAFLVRPFSQETEMENEVFLSMQCLWRLFSSVEVSWLQLHFLFYFWFLLQSAQTGWNLQGDSAGLPLDLAHDAILSHCCHKIVRMHCNCLQMHVGHFANA